MLGQIDALRSLYSGWRLPDATLDKGLAAVQAHYEGLSKMLGQPIAVPENVINDLGYTALERGKVKEAITLFQSNVDANPNSADAYDSLADAYLKDSNLLAAKGAEDQCVQLARKWANPNLIRFEQKARILISDFRNKRWKRRDPERTRSGFAGLGPGSSHRESAQHWIPLLHSSKEFSTTS